MNDNPEIEDTKPRPAYRPADPNVPPAQPPEQPASPVPAAGQPGLRAKASPYPRLSPAPAGPPRWLLWGVIGLFVLGMLGIGGAIAAFRFVLEPAQQERVMEALPFMQAFLPPRPGPDDTLPTPQASGTEVSPEDLLSGLSLTVPTETVPTPEPTQAAATEQPTDAPTHEPTLAPTEQPTAEPTAEAAAPTGDAQAAAPQPTSGPVQVSNDTILPRTVQLTGFNYQKQTWNNCGPANITMTLSYFGWTQDQAFAATFLKPGGREDKNVSPQELVAFVEEQSNLDALTRVGGTVQLLKSLLANNFPVIVETGARFEGYDWLGHYRTLVGYDDNQGQFLIMDSFLGENTIEGYTQLDADWKHFNRTFVVLYEPQRTDLIQRLLGDYMDERMAAQIALEQATAEATANSTDGHAWFNLGSSLVMLGEYERAASAFDRARVAGVPWRMTWYQFGPFEAYYGAQRYNEVLSLVDANLASGAEYVEETYYWQGRALEALGNSTGAQSAYRSALRRNPRYEQAQAALDRIGS